MSLGKFLKKLRIDEDLTLKEFGARIGVKSISYLSGIERGTQKPSKEFEDQILSNFQINTQHKEELKELILQQEKQVKEYSKFTPDQIAFARKFEQFNRLDSENKKNIHADIDKIIKKYFKE